MRIQKKLVEFCDPRNYTIEVIEPLEKAFLLELGSLWPRWAPYAEVMSAARARLSMATLRMIDEKENSEEKLLKTLFEYFRQNLIELHLEPAQFTAKTEALPEAHPLARLQAQLGYWAGNYRQEYLELDEFERCLLPLLDGSRTVDALVDAVAEKLNERGIGVREDGKELTDPIRKAVLVREQLHAVLEKLGHAAFLKIPSR